MSEPRRYFNALRKGGDNSVEHAFRFGAEIIKAETPDDGDWIFEGIASLPGRDLQGEEVLLEGLEIDYLLGRGLPPGAGGYINYNHDPTTIVGIPLEGKITPRGFWIKWKALKTPLMRKIVEQMKALKEAGWPRRYGMSIEGIVKERDPNDPTRIKRAFIRNVALTPTPVHPGTFVDFAKSLAAGAVVEFRPDDLRKSAIAAWSSDVIDIRTGRAVIRDNPYFTRDGRFKRDMDVAYFSDVFGLPDYDATWCARYALSREAALVKAIDAMDLQRHIREKSRGHPHDIIQRHLREFKAQHPECPHITADGRVKGGLRTAARHFYGCERRSGPEVNAILEMLRGSRLVKEE